MKDDNDADGDDDLISLLFLLRFKKEKLIF